MLGFSISTEQKGTFNAIIHVYKTSTKKEGDMRIPILTFGAIASFLTLNAFADTTSTVTSRNYVDAQDALKQNLIPAAYTNEDELGETVVTYTEEEGIIGERGICDVDADSGDGCSKDDLVTRDLLGVSVTTNKVCVEWVENAAHIDRNCLLWDLTDQYVYGGFCSTVSDCQEYKNQNGCSAVQCSGFPGRCQCWDGTVS